MSPHQLSGFPVGFSAGVKVLSSVASISFASEKERKRSPATREVLPVAQMATAELKRPP